MPVFSQEPNAEVPFLGKKLEVYELRPGLAITVIRNTAGHIKKYHIVPIHLTGESIGSWVSLNETVVKELIDELVPRELRGAKNQFHGITLCSGGSCSTYYGYERVSIHYIWPSRPSASQPVLTIEFLDQVEAGSGNQPTGQAEANFQ
ncbi:MAG: hypothetical protein HY774_02380 [Acidobacteria bacterium]|nr:hypothetical protein [Acidobacteriota bacterium]